MFEGVLQKMDSEWLFPIRYYLRLDGDFLIVNSLIGKQISITHTGYQCLNCALEEPIYRQGFCKNCFFTSAKVGDWIIHPQLSKAHLDIEDRDLEYEKQVQLKPHIVYFSNTGNVKVGVTRKTQTPTRWIDQGAVQALPIVEVPNRYLAGITEVALKPFISDKTSWKQMLSNVESVDLEAVKHRLKEHLPQQVLSYVLTSEDTRQFVYPVDTYPESIQRLNLNQTPHYKGVLSGIKGQYLLFSDGTVLNIRSFEGYRVRIEINEVIL